MSQDVQYITNKEGARVGVLLDLDTYRQLTSNQQDAELLMNLSREELVALAESSLATDTQAHLDDLLARNSENQLLESEKEQLDQLLLRIDTLNIVKTRACYTLRYLATIAS